MSRSGGPHIVSLHIGHPTCYAYPVRFAREFARHSRPRHSARRRTSPGQRGSRPRVRPPHSPPPFTPSLTRAPPVPIWPYRISSSTMPTYEYVCSNCNNHWEEVQRISEPPVQICPKCAQATAKRQISGGSFILKGGGWYADLYSSSKPAK